MNDFIDGIRTIEFQSYLDRVSGLCICSNPQKIVLDKRFSFDWICANCGYYGSNEKVLFNPIQFEQSK